MALNSPGAALGPHSSNVPNDGAAPELRMALVETYKIPNHHVRFGHLALFGTTDKPGPQVMIASQLLSDLRTVHGLIGVIETRLLALTSNTRLWISHILQTDWLPYSDLLKTFHLGL